MSEKEKGMRGNFWTMKTVKILLGTLGTDGRTIIR